MIALQLGPEQAQEVYAFLKRGNYKARRAYADGTGANRSLDTLSGVNVYDLDSDEKVLRVDVVRNTVRLEIEVGD